MDVSTHPATGATGKRSLPSFLWTVLTVRSKEGRAIVAGLGIWALSLLETRRDPPRTGVLYVTETRDGAGSVHCVLSVHLSVHSRLNTFFKAEGFNFLGLLAFCFYLQRNEEAKEQKKSEKGPGLFRRLE